MSWPDELAINTLDDLDDSAIGAPAADLRQRVFGLPEIQSGFLSLTSVPDDWDWAHPAVGWGLIAPDTANADGPAKAAGEDLPDPVRRLVALRRGIVLRYQPNGAQPTFRRYAADGSHEDVRSTDRVGTDPGAVPKFLLIWGGPDAVPWHVQYGLQPGFFVGRLPLQGPALDRYVRALSDDYAGLGLNVRSSVVWSVDHGARDITRLIRETVADPIARKITANAALAADAVQIGGADHPAKVDDLTNVLAERRPGLVVTTSHGATSPTTNLDRLRARLGQLVDSDRQLLDPPSVDADWVPAGGIWYAHACASAGSDGPSAFRTLIDDGTSISRTLRALGQLEPMVAPLPLALLGADRPIRAFIGHVEPTFDWSLKDPKSGAILTDSLVKTFYDRLYTGKPIGWALEEARRTANLLSGQEQTIRLHFATGADLWGEQLAVHLAAADWRTLVLLGDPAASLPV